MTRNNNRKTNENKYLNFEMTKKEIKKLNK